MIRIPRPLRRLRPVAGPALAALLLASPGAAAPGAAQEPALLLEAVEVEGAFRTGRDALLHSLGLEEGQAVTPDEVLDAVDALRRADLFASVDFRTARGSERGRFRLHLIVREKGLEFRLGTGYRDLDGWYLIPAQLRLDNRLGWGERLRLQANVGYRIAGLELLFADPRAGDGRTFWEVKLAGYGIDRPYFLDGVEYRHAVATGEVGAHAGRRFGTFRAQIGVRFQNVDPDSVPEAAQDDPFRDIRRGDDLAFENLPPPIADHVGEEERTIVHAQVQHDSRSRRRVGATPASGIWGRVRGEGLVRESADFGRVTADLRAYRAALGGAVALRLRGGAVGEAAPFYDRFHLGGLYTVRGFPSQSLSPAGGDTRFWTASLEFRAPLTGPSRDPRLLGFLFVDAGDGWRTTDADTVDPAASAGWGLRLRVPWFDSVGVDFGLPVTASPVDEAFHGNAALGWNF